MFWNEKYIEKQPLSCSQTHHLHVGHGLVPAQHHAGSGCNRLQPHVGPRHVRVQPYVGPGHVHAQPHVYFLNIIICIINIIISFIIQSVQIKNIVICITNIIIFIIT